MGGKTRDVNKSKIIRTIMKIIRPSDSPVSTFPRFNGESEQLNGGDEEDDTIGLGRVTS